MWLGSGLQDCGRLPVSDNHQLGLEQAVKNWLRNQGQYGARPEAEGPVIRDNLGHSSLSVTSRYLEFTDSEKRELLKRVEL